MVAPKSPSAPDKQLLLGKVQLGLPVDVVSPIRTNAGNEAYYGSGWRDLVPAMRFFSRIMDDLSASAPSVDATPTTIQQVEEALTCLELATMGGSRGWTYTAPRQP